MVIGNFAVRAYQVSDINNQYLFADYLNQRYISCVIMILIRLVYIIQKKYMGEMFALSILLCFYKMIDALADVYEGELQKKGYLSVAGLGMFWRVTSSMFVFIGILIFTKNLLISSFGMIIISIIMLFFFAVIPVKRLNK